MSRCAACDLEPCVCKPDAQPVFRSTYRPLPLGITKEQFGVVLFEAITAQAGRIQAEQTAEVFDRKGLKHSALEYRQAAKRLQAELEGMLPKLQPSEVRKILAMGMTP